MGSTLTESDDKQRNTRKKKNKKQTNKQTKKRTVKVMGILASEQTLSFIELANQRAFQDKHPEENH